MSESLEYRVNLDIYNGPLDLLLYLIRREEVDIHDIPIARITTQYVQYVELLQKLDPNLSGEFLVMAATLMEIKSRMLLPAPEIEGGEDEDMGLDPRADLVRQLLQYKAFKDAADNLHRAAEMQARRFPRRPGDIDFGDDRDFDMDDVQIWDLFDAFRGVMDAIGAGKAQHEVIYDDTPIELYAVDIMDRLERDGRLTFVQIFEGRTNRIEIVGLFIAILELTRMKKVLVSQGENFGEIVVDRNDEEVDESDLPAELAWTDNELPDEPMPEFEEHDEAPIDFVAEHEWEHDDEDEDSDDFPDIPEIDIDLNSPLPPRDPKPREDDNEHAD